MQNKSSNLFIGTNQYKYKQMRKLFKDLTTEENIVNFGRVIAIFIVIACTLILIKALTNPQSISFGMID